jgi:hypothetical protein
MAMGTWDMAWGFLHDGRDLGFLGLATGHNDYTYRIGRGKRENE